MPKRGTAFGHNRERKVKALLEAEGWFVIRAPGSLGLADLVAIRRGALGTTNEGAPVGPGSRVRMIEVKGTAAGPFHSFPPADRAALSKAAELAGASAELAYWPAHKELRWIPEADWPRTDKGEGESQ